MSVMAMALQEAEEDRQVARHTVRGIIAAATKRQAAASESLANRAEKIAAVAAAHAAAVDSKFVLSQRSDRCRARRAAVERRGASGVRRRGREAL